MLLMSLLAAALAQQTSPPPEQTQIAPVSEETPEKTTLETISLTGTRPVPEVQIIIQRPEIPIHSTAQILEDIDQRLAQEEEQR